MAQLRAGVIGCGAFGKYHIGKYAAHPDTHLTAVFDRNAELVAQMARDFNCQGFIDLDSFLDQVDITTIALPAKAHFEFALAGLQAGKPLFIEKPISETIAQAEQLIALADEKSLPMAIGHQERVVGQVIGLLDIDEIPSSIEAVRYGAWSPRGTDVSVTLDLMTHDLDLVSAILGPEDPIESVTASGVISRSDQFDEMDARLGFESGCAVHLRASRLKDERERWMRIIYPSGEVFIDFVSLESKNTTRHPLNLQFSEDARAKDSLGYNLGTFIDVVLGRREKPLVTAPDGLRALNLAGLVDRTALKSGQA